jgi:sugar lactone lactonase YvrE
VKRLVVIALVLFLVASSAFAERLFDYRGVFSADRGDDAKITNYILLKKGSQIRFEIEEQGHGATDKVRVARVQLTSDTSINFAEEAGITSLTLTETGIYEIALVPAAGVSGEIRFVLRVVETTGEPASPDQPAATVLTSEKEPASAAAVITPVASDALPEVISDGTSIASSADAVSDVASAAAILLPANAVASAVENVLGTTTPPIESATPITASEAAAFNAIGTGPVLSAPQPGYFLNPFVGFKFTADSINLMAEAGRQRQIKIYNMLVDGSQSPVAGSFFSPEPDVLMFLPQAVIPGAIYYLDTFDAAGNKASSYQIAAMPELSISFKPADSELLLISVAWSPRAELLANPAGQVLALNNCEVAFSADGSRLFQLSSEQIRQPFGSHERINWRARPYSLELEMPMAMIASECSVEIFAALDGAAAKTSAYRAAWHKPTDPGSADFSDVEASDDQIYEKAKEEFSIQSFTAREQLPDNASFTLEKSFLLVDNEADSLLSWPQDVVWDENGSLWVLDSQLRRVSNFNTAGILRTSFGSRGDTQGGFGLPVALTQKNSTLFVSDTARHAIHKFTTDGLFVVSIFSESDTGVVIDLPGGICFRKDEMWVADRGTARILCFNQQGGFLGSFGSTPSAPIESPVSVRADQDSLFILEKNGLVKKFSPMGQFDATFQSGSSDGSGLEVDRWGGVWVCDAGLFRVLRFSRKGATLSELKAPPAPKPWLPTSIAVRSDGKVAVTDAANKMLHIFSTAE